MKERPILFSAPMVRALLTGTKTQTRRVVKPAPVEDPRWAGGFYLEGRKSGPRAMSVHAPHIALACPYGAPGDRLWVRETFRFPESLDGLSPAEVGEKAIRAGYPTPWCPTQFEADGTRRTAHEWRGFVTPPQPNEPGRLRASMHMPRWASRITLEITGVRVERLNDISDADAAAEGWPGPGATSLDAMAWYSELWDEINGPGAWESNPWVWAISFQRIGA
jgi:hypothetical protein